MPAFADRDLEQRIQNAQRDIKSWAEGSDLWRDSGFTSYAERVQGEPGEEAVVFILYSDGHLARLLDEDLDPRSRAELDQICGAHGFWFENYDGCSYYFFATTEEMQAAYDEYFHWKWVCSLIVEDFGDVYAELYRYFQARPERLYNLHHREFEILLYRVFQSLGYESEVGPGIGDGGVDVRLLQRGPLGDTLTYVQAKRYAPHRPIRLDAVQALRGAVANDGAHHGIFVTTSRYLPGAADFARRSNGVLQLKTSDDVAEWCKQAQEGIIQDKSLLISDAHLLSVLRRVDHGEHALVTHAHTGYRTITNSFALVLKETKHAALLMRLPRRNLSQDSYGLEGHEAPVLDPQILGMKQMETVFRAKRSVSSDGCVSYWDGRNLYSTWNRQSCFFSYID
ncbi:restriction endonuclease [Pseudomonas sp. CFBP13528]|uniref:Restriction endonuclease n=1 Tax=Pseudomonas granadensis TaxID=1421430 RepID=A0ABX7G9Q9_9PSED|nr:MULTISPECIES: restriction endonuclease [Pseudomonas]QRK81882.1 restriction endonuclease [Pseudomonas granadensis]TKK29074.1 restriction endonuclease [Pseudomonas sp. CFBP13528]